MNNLNLKVKTTYSPDNVLVNSECIVGAIWEVLEQFKKEKFAIDYIRKNDTAHYELQLSKCNEESLKNIAYNYFDKEIVNYAEEINRIVISSDFIDMLFSTYMSLSVIATVIEKAGYRILTSMNSLDGKRTYILIGRPLKEDKQ